MTKKKSKGIILDLCGGTGSWSRSYKDAGYSVYTITLPDYDIRLAQLADGFITFRGPKGYCVIRANAVHGILAAPPCTMFSFARTKAKTPRNIKQGMECVRACLEIIWYCQSVVQDTNKKTLPLKWWALENPYHGLLKNIIGRPAFTFDPWEFGDGYQKRTALWGSFTDPIKKPVPMTKEAKIKAKTNSHRQTRRSITPAGFANAFFKANQ